MAYVYRHLRTDTNEVFYIGIGSEKSRYKSRRDRNKHWKNIVNKVGFIAEVFENDLSWEEACEREKYWIKYYGRKDLNEGNLVNMTDGGEGAYGMRHSDETKQKMSELSKNMSDETKQKIRDAMTGRVISDEWKRKIGDANRGKIRTDEVKNILSESHKGYTHATIQKDRISKKLKGIVRSDETKKKIGDANRGMKRSEEVKQKLRDAHQRRRVREQQEKNSRTI